MGGRARCCALCLLALGLPPAAAAADEGLPSVAAADEACPTEGDSDGALLQKAPAQKGTASLVAAAASDGRRASVVIVGSAGCSFPPGWKTFQGQGGGFELEWGDGDPCSVTTGCTGRAHMPAFSGIQFECLQDCHDNFMAAFPPHTDSNPAKMMKYVNLIIAMAPGPKGTCDDSTDLPKDMALQLCTSRGGKFCTSPLHLNSGSDYTAVKQKEKGVWVVCVGIPKIMRGASELSYRFISLEMWPLDAHKPDPPAKFYLDHLEISPNTCMVSPPPKCPGDDQWCK